MARPNLRIVEQGPARERQPHGPERRLRSLFRKEARLEAELLELRQEIGRERRRYGTKHFLLILPSLDTLRRLFS